VFAKWLVSPENPFLRATWSASSGRFMGRGIVEPVDDVAPNPPSNPGCSTRQEIQRAAIRL
jgi:hypothetical protein